MLADDVPGDRLNSQRRNVRASGPANASASATNPNHPTRTCKHLEPDLLLHAPWWHHHTGKKAIAIGGSYRDIDEAYLLQRPLPATTVAQRAASRHTPSPKPQQGLRNQHQPVHSQLLPRRKWITEALLLSIAGPCLRVSARKEERQTVLPWCRRKTPPLGHGTGARARYLLEDAASLATSVACEGFVWCTRTIR